MNVNKVNHYVSTPRVGSRPFTKFVDPHGQHLTFNAGKLVPIYCREIYPNTRVKLNWKTVTRLLTPKYPTMDIANLDVFFFFVPNIEIWDKWKNFLGENDTDYWTEKNSYLIPKVSVPLYLPSDWSNNALAHGCRLRNVGDLADYMGVPLIGTLDSSVIGVQQKYIDVSVLPFRAYVKIWNDWFRDENFQEPCRLTVGSGDNLTLYPDGDSFYREGTPAGNPADPSDLNTVKDYVKYAEIGAALCPVDKYKDYFSSCLPQPQKGIPVELPIGGYAPLVRGGSEQELFLGYKHGSGYDPEAQWGKKPFISINTPSGFKLATGDSSATFEFDNPDSPGAATIDYRADLSAATAVTVEQLRLAFATQRFLELSAVGGTRYIELISYMFGANCPDEYLHRSRFLGGKSIPLNITPITQLSGSSSESLGQVGAFSNTATGDFAFDEKFEEHGFIIGLVTVRTQHSYSQGIPKYFMKRNELDYYFPCFAHLGEQPVYNKELFVQGTSEDNEVFGYQQAWDELRHTPSRSAGYLRMGVPGALEQWTYADKFASLPVLGADFIKETSANLARTLSVTEYTHQFISDWFFTDEIYQILPFDSVPKLVG